MLRIGSVILAAGMFACGGDSNEGGTSRSSGSGDRRGSSWQYAVRGENLDLSRSGTLLVRAGAGGITLFQASSSGGLPGFRIGVRHGTGSGIEPGEYPAEMVSLPFPDEGYSCMSGDIMVTIRNGDPVEATFAGPVTCNETGSSTRIPAQVTGSFNR